MPSIAELVAVADGDVLNVIVETPRGSRAKYKFDAGTGLFCLHKALALGFSYPFAFGFVAGTRGEDGDPIDILLLTTLDPPTGCLVPTRAIGVLELEQQDPGEHPVRNDRLIGVPHLAHDDRQPEALGDLSARELGDLEGFFVQSAGRDGKEVRVIGHGGPHKALELVRKAMVAP